MRDWSKLMFSICLSWIVFGCSGGGSREGPQAETETYDTETTVVDTGTYCSGVAFELDKVPVQTLFLIDASGSMSDGGKWIQVGNVLAMILARYADAEHYFGYHVFPYDDFDFMNPGDGCSIYDEVIIDSGLGKKQVILEAHDELWPSSGTPLYCALSQFLDPSYAPAFNNDDMESYLVVMSDGGDSCGHSCGSDSDSAGNDPLAYTTLGENLLRNGIYSIAIQFGTSVNALDQLTAAGGTPFNDALSADDEASLLEAFEEAILSARSCRVHVDPVDVDGRPQLVNFTLDDVVIPHDEDCMKERGWSWTTEDYTEAILCNKSCFELRSHPESVLEATFGCETITE